MFKLGTKVKDRATGASGTLTHYQVTGSSQHYNFQPAELTEDGQPADRRWISIDRVVDGVESPPRDLCLSALGTEAEDTATGFKGIITAITLHQSGCIHAHIQPPANKKKPGKIPQSCDFDIRTLKGEAIPSLTEQERTVSERKNPSPAPHDRCGPKPL